jgi:hypothetical protein
MRESRACSCVYAYAPASINLEVLNHHDERVRPEATEDSSRFDDTGIGCRTFSINLADDRRQRYNYWDGINNDEDADADS